MSGKYNGCQARVKDRQPLAQFSHCALHKADLVMQQSYIFCQLAQNANE